MPNHTQTQLQVVGPDSEVERFIAAIFAGPEDVVDFNKLVPIPEELEKTSAPTTILTQEEIDVKMAEFNALPDDHWSKVGGVNFGVGITKETSNKWKARYGADNWYDWKCLRWGTKWGAYDATEWVRVTNGDTLTAFISYQTAWSPATAFFITASQQFPTLSFTHSFADEGGGFLGYETIVNGKVTKEREYEWDSDDGITLRKELGVWYDDEDGDDE